MSAEPKSVSAKKSYRTPKLRTYGDVGRITRGNLVNATPDSMKNPDTNKTMS